jgi:transposase
MRDQPERLGFIDETAVKTNLTRLRARAPPAAKALSEHGCWFLFLPPYSPALNPIEMAFAKLKAHLRRIATRTFDDIIQAIGNVCDLFSPQECRNFTKARRISLNVNAKRLKRGL